MPTDHLSEGTLRKIIHFTLHCMSWQWCVYLPRVARDRLAVSTCQGAQGPSSLLATGEFQERAAGARSGGRHTAGSEDQVYPVRFLILI